MRRCPRLILILVAIALASGCGGNQVIPDHTPEPETEKPEAAATTSVLDADTVLVYDGLVRVDSLQAVASPTGAHLAFDTPEGGAWLAVDGEAPTQFADHAQVGCMITDPQGTTWVGTIERDQSAPVSHLVIRKFADGKQVGEAWQPSNPPLWPEAGSRCAFVNTESEVTGIVSRGREARSDAVIDLWYSPMTGQGLRYEVGTHVPRIIQTQPLADGALLALDHVERNEDGNREHTWSLWTIAADGSRLRHTVDPDNPIGLAAEERTVAIAAIESGSKPPGGAVERSHATLSSAITARAKADEPWSGLRMRTDVFDPVSPASAPRLFFAEGQWWAVLVPEAYVLRGQSDPAPYRERVINLVEGRAVVRELPQDVHGVQVAVSGDRALWIGVGAPDETRPGVANGVIRIEAKSALGQ